MSQALTPTREKTQQVTGEHTYPLALTRVTEVAAIAAAKVVGHNDRKGADKLATDAMRKEMNHLPLSGKVVIGEGERDEAPMLYIGEELGAGGPEVDIAVDPLECTNYCATGRPGSITMMATSERGGLFAAPDVYMECLVSGKEAKGKISMEMSVEENLKALAEAYNRDVTDLTVAILERDYNDAVIEDVRKAGARIKLFLDGTLINAVASMVTGDNIHVFMGGAAAPESVIKAACAKCLDGHMEGRFRAYKGDTKKRLAEAGLDEKRIYTSEELAPGKDIHFAATGVTSGDVLEGVRFFGGGVRTHSIVLSTHERAMRFIDTVHAYDKEKMYFSLK